MTARKIFALGAALIYERTEPGAVDDEMELFTPFFLTQIMQECLPYENAIRLNDGREELTEAPVVVSLDDEIDYSDRILRTAVPYALASHYFRDNNDQFHEQTLRNMYAAALMDATPFVTDEIRSCY